MNETNETKETTEINETSTNNMDDVRHYTFSEFEQYYLNLNAPPPEPQKLNFLF